MNDETIHSYYKLNFHLIKEHSYSYEDIENMMPWEREIQIHLANHWTQKRNQEIEKQNLRTAHG